MSVVAFGFGASGLRTLMTLFSIAQKQTDFGEAWVGSAVAYGPYQEFGTALMTERPHWREAIPAIAAEIAGDSKVQGQILDALMTGGAGGDLPPEVFRIDSGETPPIKVALMIERKVKEIIRAKGIIDTGNYRGSIATGRSEAGAFAESAMKADPDTVRAER